MKSDDRSIYRNSLDTLQEYCSSLPDTRMFRFLLVQYMIIMNMRYELIAFNQGIKEHPYILTKQIIDDTLCSLKQSAEIGFIEGLGNTAKLRIKEHAQETLHQGLFNQLWNRYEGDEFIKYINRYQHRIKVNKLEQLIAGKSCLDLGCGNGAFCFALFREGAKMATGIDFGTESIEHAKLIAKKLEVESGTDFQVSTVYDLPFRDEQFDFIIQNGVFHHLTDENKAILEASRVLKKGGYFWYYTVGKGSIAGEIWDCSVAILEKVPEDFMIHIMEFMNISEGKLNFLADGLNAKYRRTNLKEITARLTDLGFGNFRRLTGGTQTDFDMDVIESDPYGKEKFGDGDLRILAQKI